MKFRDGRIIYKTDEDSAIRLLIAIKAIVIIRRIDNVTKLLEEINNMNRSEIFWWYSLFLKIGNKALIALRKAYT